MILKILGERSRKSTYPKLDLGSPAWRFVNIGCKDDPSRTQGGSTLRFLTERLHQTVLILLLLATLGVWAQGPSANKTEMRIIQRVKTTRISSLDRSLPNVTLEFFLKYEADGAPIKWEVNDCEEKNRDRVVDHGGDSAMCVQADFSLKDGRAATVLVSIGTFKRGPVDVPTVSAVRVTYLGGTIRRLRHLSDLPAELRRPLPKGPQDLPAPVSGLLSPFNSQA